MSVFDLQVRPERRINEGTQVGDQSPRLLAGPTGPNAESFASHRSRLGPIDWQRHSPRDIRDLVHEAGLVGRGGGEFPLWKKLDTAVRAIGVPLVVVNASEGEPASRKDATLLSRRPHLVLDGAEVVASAVGASHVVVYLSEGDNSIRGLRRAVMERDATGPAKFHLVEAPDRYVAGESSAIVSFLSSGIALPRHHAVTAAEKGASDRPTVVSNTETYAHVAMIARYGAKWFRTCGSNSVPGSTLVTLAGSVSEPGLVLEVVAETTFGEVLAEAGGIAVAPRAVLVGGYAGTWVDGKSVWSAILERHWLRQAGAPLGCGMIAVLDHEQCGVAETARLLTWMADQSAGQCGPCVSGLPAIAVLAHDLAAGRATRRDLKRLRELAVSVRGRGACGHPTGAAQLLESSLDVFADETHKHLNGRSCIARGVGLPLAKRGSVR